MYTRRISNQSRVTLISSHFLLNGGKCSEQKVFSRIDKFFIDNNFIKQITRKRTMTKFLIFIKIAGNHEEYFERGNFVFK